MPEARGDELRESLVGTWFAVALILELLIASEVAEREYVVALLSEFENRARPSSARQTHRLRCRQSAAGVSNPRPRPPDPARSIACVFSRSLAWRRRLQAGSFVGTRYTHSPA